jgi:hypothetical protein
MDLFRKTMKPVEQVLKDAGVKKDEIDDVSFRIHIGVTPGADSVSGCPRWRFHPNPQGAATLERVFQR